MKQSILSRTTGELESMLRGFNMLYHKNYEEITEAVIASNKDLRTFNWITNEFTYKRVECAIVHSMCGIDVSQPKFSKLVKKLVELNYLKRVARGIYRLNPYIYVPFRADASELQSEWNSLTKDN